MEEMFTTHVSCHQLLSIIDRSDCRLSLGDEGVVVGVVGDEQHLWKSRHKVKKNIRSIEDAVAMICKDSEVQSSTFTKQLRFFL